MSGDPLGEDLGMIVGADGALDLDPTSRRVSGARAVAFAVARRYVTRPGQLFWAPHYGKRLADLLNAGLTARELGRHQAETAAEALKDERVLAATARLELDAATGKLRARVDGETADGPFRLVLAASAVSVELLAVEA
jgi:hypothetical protein